MNKQIRPIVYKILQEDEYAREDNWYLIQQVAIKMLPCESGTAFGKVIQGLRYKGISLEAVTRAKRKFFEENPNMKSEKAKEISRVEEEKYYMEYVNHIPRID